MDMHIEEFQDKTNYTSDNYLAINSCGFQLYNQATPILRSKGRLDYHFLYIVAGECTAETPSGVHTLLAGDLLLYRPHEKQLYTFSQNSVSKSYFIHFAGFGAEEILRISGMTEQSVFHIGCDKILLNTFNNIVNDFVPKTDNIMSISWFLQFCMYAKRFLEGASSSIFDERISRVMKYMNQHYMQEKSIDFYADMCQLSRARFCNLFKAVTGSAPHQYLSKIRLQQIKYLLTYSDMNVSEIAAATGFQDVLYMSRFFKKRIGCSPKEYMQKHRISSLPS